MTQQQLHCEWLLSIYCACVINSKCNIFFCSVNFGSGEGWVSGLEIYEWETSASYIMHWTHLLVCLCMCVCMHACVCVYVYACMYACTRVCMRACMYVYSGWVLGSGPKVSECKPHSGNFPSSFPSASHQSTQIRLGTWHLLGCKFKAFSHETAMVQVGLGCPHHLL